jgi:hypothetical protein
MSDSGLDDEDAFTPSRHFVVGARETVPHPGDTDAVGGQLRTEGGVDELRITTNDKHGDFQGPLQGVVALVIRNCA